MKNQTIKTLVTYSLPNGKVNSKEITKGILLLEFLKQLKDNKCKVISQETIK